MAWDPIWHPYTPEPPIGPETTFVKAEGQYVYSIDGKKYFDGTSSWWCNIHGHCHPRLASALADQAHTLDQILLSPHSHPVATELAEKLLERLPPNFKKIFYSDDGSTAVEAAMKMLLQYWHLKGEDRKLFVSLSGAYHGDTLGAVSISDTPLFHHYFDTVKIPSLKVPQPYCYRCPLGKRFPECEVACADPLEITLKENAKQIAGFFIEPLVMGASGMVIYPKQYVDRALTLCKEYGVPVVFDEVFTGFGRTGSFFALDTNALKPDIVCLSKGLTSGMLPLGVTAVSGEIWDAFTGGREKTFFHGHTFTGNGLSCRVALESLKLFEEERTLEKNQIFIDQMKKETERFVKLPVVGDVRQQGMIWALELSDTHKEIGWQIAEELWKEGVWIRPLRQIIYFVPPYCSTTEDLHHAFDCLFRALARVKS